METDYQTAYRALVQAGLAANSRRAYQRDVGYFFAWSALALHLGEHYPVSVETVCRFILDHIQGLPPTVEAGLLAQRRKRQSGPLALPTLRRYLASVSVAHAERGHPSPTRDVKVTLLLRRAAAATRHRPMQKAAITRDVLTALLATCEASLRGARDRALLLVGFSSGGRRRSELRAMQISDLEKIADGYLLHLRHSKTDQIGRGHTVPILGEAAAALRHWLVQSGIREGALFRGILPNGALTAGISGDTINSMIKKRIQRIGLDPTAYGAHSLRAGFLTEAAHQGIALPDSMALSGHRDANVALKYYRNSALAKNPAAKL